MNEINFIIQSCINTGLIMYTYLVLKREGKVNSLVRAIMMIYACLYIFEYGYLFKELCNYVVFILIYFFDISFFLITLFTKGVKKEEKIQ